MFDISSTYFRQKKIKDVLSSKDYRLKLRDLNKIARLQEIADRLNLPEGTVKSRINRGRTELARQIQKLREQQDAVPRTGVPG